MSYFQFLSYFMISCIDEYYKTGLNSFKYYGNGNCTVLEPNSLTVNGFLVAGILFYFTANDITNTKRELHKDILLL